jgi:hypothetical protein
MPRTVLAVLALLASSPAALACGTERWPVKVGIDQDAGRVVQQPQPATIRDLVSLPAPPDPNARQNSRFAPAELTVFQVHGVLTALKREPDEDYHLVIADPKDPTLTMIVEAPNPRCAVGSAFAAQIATVRATLNRRFGRFRGQLKPNVPVSVTGVAFFDFFHDRPGRGRAERH